MKYAVIESGGKQYVAEPGSVLTLDKIDHQEGDKVSFDKVLLVRDEDKVSIGTPHVTGITVSGKVVKQYKGEKLDVMKFRAKTRYRGKIGFRPLLTDVRIEDITSGSPKATSKKREK